MRQLSRLCAISVVVAAMVVVPGPVAAQDDTGTFEWTVLIPRGDRTSTDSTGFTYDEATETVWVAMTRAAPIETVDGLSIPAGTVLVPVNLDGSVGEPVPVAAPIAAMALTADGDIVASSRDRSLVRLGPDGTERWVRHTPGIGDPAVAVTADGTIVLAGRITSPVTFGAGEPGELTIAQPNRLASTVIAWFDPDGTFLAADVWVSGSEPGVAAAPDGTIRVAAAVHEPVVVVGAGTGPGVDVEPIVSDENRRESTLLASYAADRTLAWVVDTGGSHSGDVMDVAVDASGAATIWQSHDTTSVIGPGSPNAVEVAPLRTEGEFGDDHLMMKFDADGGFEWVHIMGSATYSEEEYRSLGVRSDGAVIATGTLATGPEVSIGGADGMVLEVTDHARHFVSVYEPGGSLVWATALGSANFDTAWGAELLPNGDAIVFARTGGPVRFGLPGEEIGADDPRTNREDGLWVIARINGADPPPEPEPTTTTTTTTTAVAPAADESEDEPEAATPEPEPDAPTPESDGDGGGSALPIILVVLGIGGVVGVAVSRKQAGSGGSDQ